MRTFYKILFWPVFLILTFSNCKKDKTDPEPKIEYKFTLSKNRVVAQEVVTIKLREKLARKISYAKLEEKEIPLLYLNDSTYIFLIPEDAMEGKYKIALDGSVSTQPIEIAPLPNIQSPTTYIDNYLAQFDDVQKKVKNSIDTAVHRGIITKINGDELLMNVTSRIEQAKLKFSSSSDSEKKTAALYLSANRPLIDSLIQMSSEANTDISGGRLIPSCTATMRNGEYHACIFSKLFILDYALINLGRALLVTKEPLSFAICAVGFGYALNQFFITLSELTARPLITVNEAIAVDGLREMAIVFENGRSRKMTMRIPVRNFQENLDINSTNLAVKTVAVYIGYLRDVKNLLSGIFDFEIPSAPLIKGYIYPESKERLSIEIIDHPDIKATIQKIDLESFDVVFQSNKKEKQNFDFKIRYDYEGGVVEQKVDGNTLLGSDKITYRGFVSQSKFHEIMGNESINCHTKVHFTDIDLSVEMKSGEKREFSYANLKATFHDLNLDPGCSFSYPPANMTFQPTFFEYFGGDDLVIDFYVPQSTETNGFFAKFKGKFYGDVLNGILTINRVQPIKQYSFSMEIPIDLPQVK